MSAEGLINICQAVSHGDSREITNLKTGEQGTVINVTGDKLTVRVEQSSKVWSYEDCKERILE